MKKNWRDVSVTFKYGKHIRKLRNPNKKTCTNLSECGISNIGPLGISDPGITSKITEKMNHTNAGKNDTNLGFTIFFRKSKYLLTRFYAFVSIFIIGINENKTLYSP